VIRGHLDTLAIIAGKESIKYSISSKGEEKEDGNETSFPLSLS
jgi:hypothetical protein